MTNAHKIIFQEIVFPAILSAVLFSAAVFFSPLGILFSIFCPIPIILTYLYRGQKIGIVCLASVAILLSIFLSIRDGFIFFVEYGLVAVVMAECIRRKYPLEKILFYSVGVSFLLGGTLIYLLTLSQEINLSSLMADQIKQNIDYSNKFYQEMGLSSSEIDKIKLYSEELTSTFVRLIPSWIIASSIFGVLLNYLMVKKIWNKYVGNSYFESENLEKWSASEYLIWLLISSGVLLLIPAAGLHSIGLNLLVISLLIYFYQGIAIVLFYLRKKTVPFFLKAAFYVLLIIQPLLLFFVILLGIFDVWVDFRKLKEET